MLRTAMMDGAGWTGFGGSFGGFLQALGEFLAEGDGHLDIKAAADECQPGLLAGLFRDGHAQAAGDALAFFKDEVGVGGDRADGFAMAAIAGRFSAVLNGVAAQGADVGGTTAAEAAAVGFVLSFGFSEACALTFGGSRWDGARRLAGIAEPGFHLSFG